MKKLLLLELDQWPEGKGVSILASGHNDYSGRKVSIELRGAIVALDPD